MIEIKETNIKDIDNVQRLWADGDVMRFVGFPNGLHQTSEEMKGWFQWIESNRPVLNHYSIFENGNYCGESFYEIDEEHQKQGDDRCLDQGRVAPYKPVIVLQIAALLLNCHVQVLIAFSLKFQLLLLLLLHICFQVS